jgi:HPt (histidine-containing phosphotransfer) domain-containing protein
LRDIELALVRYEPGQVEKAAHNLKGSALTLGAKHLAEFCHRLETEASQGSLQVAAQLLNPVRVEYSRVRDALMTRTASDPAAHI